ncbi:MAG: deoxyribose-phosphate aldolase [Sedimentisphaerales bacterium]|nr:deoxyribose-phosphate aldolase [Sedimentisphaerales bacterium]
MIVSNEKDFAGVIDHTLLKPEATSGQIKRLCDEAIQYGFHTVFTNPRWTPVVADLLHGSQAAVGGVVSFPLGNDFTKIKAAQAKELIMAGADEIDMMADIAAIIEGNERYLARQLEAVRKVCHSMRPKVLLKVIIEAAALTTEQKIFVCKIADKVGVDFVKTSTGTHHAGGATVEDVKLMKEYAPHCKIKASGGIRTAKEALAFLEAGADRIGTSSSVQIIEQFKTGLVSAKTESEPDK